MFTGTLAMNYNAKLVDFANSVVQPKYDGIRCQILEVHDAQTKNDVKLGRVVRTRTCTRSGLYIVNNYVRSLLDTLPIGLDGELVAVDSEGKELPFSQTTSALASVDGQPKFQYIVYDYINDYNAWQTYEQRMLGLAYQLQHCDYEWLKMTKSWQVESEQDLNAIVESLIAEGYEGAIIRRTDMLPLPGRSTNKKPAVMRIKSWADCEAKIVRVVPDVYGDCETNRKQCPELIGKPKDIAASFECEGLPGTKFEGQTFRAPLSVPDDIAKQYLASSELLVGKICKVRYLSAGVVDKPRLPVCVGLREAFDIG